MSQVCRDRTWISGQLPAWPGRSQRFRPNNDHESYDVFWHYEPRGLILGEPTGGLNPRLRRTPGETFATWPETGTSLGESTHANDEALHYAHIAVILEGRVIALESAVELVRQQSAIDL